MKLEEIKFADILLVYIDKKTNTLHCRKHGAMNKMNVFEDEGGIWRCLLVVSKTNDTVCRAGCKQIKDNTEG